MRVKRPMESFFFPVRRDDALLKQLQKVFQLGLHYRIGSPVEDMIKFREFLGEIMALKQSVVKLPLTLIGSHHLHLHPCIHFWKYLWLFELEEEIFCFPMSLGNCQELNINLNKQCLKGERRRADKYLKEVNTMDREELFIKIQGKKGI